MVSLLATSGDGAPPKSGHVHVALLADTSTVAPGRPFTVAIVMKLDPNWHVYFKDPGDSGMPPSVKWTLPEGITAGELQFPKPKVLKTPAGTNFVYQDEVWLLATLTPRPDFKAGSAVEISVDAKWLECDDDVCLPGKQHATLALDTGDLPTPANTEQFDAWRVKVKQAESFDPASAK